MDEGVCTTMRQDCNTEGTSDERVAEANRKVASARHAQPKTRAHAKISQLSAPRGRLSLAKLYLGEQRPGCSLSLARSAPCAAHLKGHSPGHLPAGRPSKDRK